MKRFITGAMLTTCLSPLLVTTPTAAAAFEASEKTTCAVYQTLSRSEQVAAVKPLLAEDSTYGTRYNTAATAVARHCRDLPDNAPITSAIAKAEAAEARK